MAYTLIWSPTARFDLWDVLSYIPECDPDTAALFGQCRFDAVERLLDFPESGRVVPEFLDPAIREIIHKPCRIVYRLNKHEALVEIARIRHATRGIPEVLACHQSGAGYLRVPRKLMIVNVQEE